MANLFESQVILDTNKRAVLKFTGVFDGSGQETANTKIIGKTLFGALAADANNRVLVSNGGTARANYNYAINRVVAIVAGGSVQIKWDGGTPATALILTNGYCDINSQDDLGTIPNNAINPNGNVTFTSIGAVAQSAYSIQIDIRKGPNQANQACDYQMGQLTKPSDFNFGTFSVKP